MFWVVAEFFGVWGVDMTPPATFSELMPWFFQVMLGIILIFIVFKFFLAVPTMLFGSVRR